MKQQIFKMTLQESDPREMSRIISAKMSLGNIGLGIPTWHNAREQNF
jgi:hypothetical protein